MNLTDFKHLFDEAVNNYLDTQISDIKRDLHDKTIMTMLDYIKPLILSGGKRVRPYFCYTIYQAYQQTTNKSTEHNDIIQLSMMFEIFHTFCLIHDDIIDKADKRHNVDAMHTAYGKLLHDSHEWMGQAIQVADLLFGRSYEILFAGYQSFDHQTIRNVQQTFATMIRKVVYGQILDVRMTGRKEATIKEIETKTFLKTAYYTFISPIKAGAQLGNAPENDYKTLYEIGKHLGIAFQIRDDLRDIVAKKSDKSLFNDIQEGQQTILTQHVFDHGTQIQQQLLRQKLGQQLTEEDKKQLEKIFTTTGAIDVAHQWIWSHINQAKQFLNQRHPPHIQYKQEIEVLTDHIAQVE